MSQPVKLSDALVLDARLVGQLEQRSIAGQVEYWAVLGKRMDALLDGQARRRVLHGAAAQPLSALVDSVNAPEGQARLQAHLESRPFPHFQPHPNRKGVFLRIEADGSQSVGRFVRREFVAESPDVEAAGSANSVPA